MGSLSVPASMSELGREISPPASKKARIGPQKGARKGAREVFDLILPYKIENIRKLRKL